MISELSSLFPLKLKPLVTVRAILEKQLFKENSQSDNLLSDASKILFLRLYNK